MNEEPKVVIDEQPKEEQTEGADQELEVAAMLPWLEYFYPKTVTALMNKKYGLFGGIVFLYYTSQFICCVCACNFYSD